MRPKVPQKGNEVKRYLLALPEEVFNDVQELADDKHTTIAEIFRTFTTLGLTIAKVQKTPGATFLIREAEKEREIMLL